MNITSAKFIKGIVNDDELLDDGKPQIAIIGRSNAGKSTFINCLTKIENLARTSSFPGRTREINLFLINNAFYLVDLPGYGFAKVSQQERGRIDNLIYWYLFESGYSQKMVVLILDANVGATESDLRVLKMLNEHKKNVVIIANKTDKIKSSELQKNLAKINSLGLGYKIIPHHYKKKIDLSVLIEGKL